MNILRRRGSHTRLKNEDDEEIRHTRCQLLISKILEQADRRQRRPRRMVLVMSKLKMVQMGIRMKKARKAMSIGIRKAKVAINVHEKVIMLLKVFKQAICTCREAR